MRRSLSGFAASLALVLGAALALGSGASARSGGHGFDHFSRLELGLEQLELDSETRDFVYGVLDEARTSKRELREALHAEYEEMKVLLDQAEPDQEAVLAQADVIGKLRTEERKIELRAFVQVLGALDADGREALRSMSRDPHRDPHHRGGGCEGGRESS